MFFFLILTADVFPGERGYYSTDSAPETSSSIKQEPKDHFKDAKIAEEEEEEEEEKNVKQKDDGMITDRDVPKF